MIKVNVDESNYIMLNNSLFRIDWSLGRHRLLTANRHYQFQRQFTCSQQILKYKKPMRRINYFIQRINLFDEQICRVYLKSIEFSLLKQQMDVDFLFYELLEQQGVFKCKIFNRFVKEKKQFIHFNLDESFIPYIGQIIFYDKILDRYSIHQY